MSQALLDAAKKGNLEEVAKLLSEVGINVNHSDGSGQTALYFAAKKGHVAVVERLLAAGVKFDAPNIAGFTPLYIAAEKGHGVVVERLLAVGAKVDALNNAGSTPLHIAAQFGHVVVVERLLAAKADLNASEEDGFTPLYIAAQNGHGAVVDKLIAAKADVNASDNDGYTPLHIAAQQGHGAVVERLIKAKIDVNASRKDGVTPLHIAAQKGYGAVVEVLIKAKADVNASDNDGYTPLHITAESGHIAVVEKLLKAGATVDALTNDGVTPLDLAAGKYKLAVMERLLLAKADVNKLREDSFSVLLTTCNEDGNEAKHGVEMLFRCGAFIDAPICERPLLEWLEEKKGYSAIPMIEAAEDLLAAAEDPETSKEDIDGIFAALKTGLNARMQENADTALHIAIEKNPELALRLIAQGIPMDILNKNKFTAYDILSQQNSKPFKDLCFALIEMNKLKKLVLNHQKMAHIQMPIPMPSAVAVTSATSSSVDVKSMKDHKTLSETNTTHSYPNASASASTSSAGALAVYASSIASATGKSKSNSEFETSLTVILKLMYEKTVASIDVEETNLTVHQNSDEASGSYFETARQTIYFEAGDLILSNPLLFPESLGIAKHLLSKVPKNHPQFAKSNDLLFDIINIELKDKKLSSDEQHKVNQQKIQYLLAAGEKSIHHETLGHLMADEFGLGLNAQAFQGIKSSCPDSMNRLFKLALKERAEKEAAQAREKEAREEIERLKLLLKQHGVSSEAVLVNKTHAEESSTSSLPHTSSKRKRVENSDSSAALIATQSSASTGTATALTFRPTVSGTSSTLILNSAVATSAALATAPASLSAAEAEGVPSSPKRIKTQ